MSKNVIKRKQCLKCGCDIIAPHPNRKRCVSCAKIVAQQCTSHSIKKWRLAHLDHVKAMNYAWVRRFPLKRRLSHARQIAHQHNRIYSLTEEQMLHYWHQPCDYCGQSILNETGIGLDRLNNSIGYISSNVVPCCGDCNYIKGDILTHDEMKIAMEAILRYRQSTKKR